MLFRFQFLGFFIVFECILFPWLQSLGSLAGPVIPSGEVPFNLTAPVRWSVGRRTKRFFLCSFATLRSKGVDGGTPTAVVQDETDAVRRGQHARYLHIPPLQPRRPPSTQRNTPLHYPPTLTPTHVLPPSLKIIPSICRCQLCTGTRGCGGKQD
ncbi:hypothetical protein FPQ18DRAFT_58465 [Pyronema domesticum]|nr:hypothetical protein FPQ18DRAFT_58465 [Pyronema domesticum]